MPLLSSVFVCARVFSLFFLFSSGVRPRLPVCCGSALFFFMFIVLSFLKCFLALLFSVNEKSVKTFSREQNCLSERCVPHLARPKVPRTRKCATSCTNCDKRNKDRKKDTRKHNRGTKAGEIRVKHVQTLFSFLSPALASL